MLVNDYGNNNRLLVPKYRYNDTPQSELKTILMWNLAYGSKDYDIGHGRDPFFKYRCPETRCYATADRDHLDSVDKYDAILFHQRSFDFKDLPAKRSQHQRYIHWIIESAQYLYMDIHQLDGIFNWTMTYRRDSDFYLPYGRFHQVRDHPPAGSPELDRYIKEFGRKNKHLARSATGNRTNLQAAWFVSHCATQARREKYAKSMEKYMDIHIYGDCSRGPNKHSCPRTRESDCYAMMEKNYKFYLSFENSICDDYVTEKYFNILGMDVIPLSFSGGNFTAMGAPPHSAINVLDFKSPKHLVSHLEKLHRHDELYAEYFWWKDFYVVRNRMEDRAQAYCDLCQKLNDPSTPSKVYKDMYQWWVRGSKCKKLKSSMFQ